MKRDGEIVNGFGPHLPRAWRVHRTSGAHNRRPTAFLRSRGGFDALPNRKVVTHGHRSQVTARNFHIDYPADPIRISVARKRVRRSSACATEPTRP